MNKKYYRKNISKNISECNHDKYITRIKNDARDDEWLQFICEKDGQMFKEIKIIDTAKNG